MKQDGSVHWVDADYHRAVLIEGLHIDLLKGISKFAMY